MKNGEKMKLFGKINVTRNFSGGGTPAVSSAEDGNEMPYDKCALCGKITSVEENTPIEMRSNYVIGCGQLCRDCYYELYNKYNTEGNAVSSTEELEKLLKMCSEE